MATLPSIKTFLVEGYIETRVPWSVEVEAYTEEEAEDLAEALVDSTDESVDFEDYNAEVTRFEARHVREQR